MLPFSLFPISVQWNKFNLMFSYYINSYIKGEKTKHLISNERRYIIKLGELKCKFYSWGCEIEMGNGSGALCTLIYSLNKRSHIRTSDLFDLRSRKQVLKGSDDAL